MVESEGREAVLPELCRVDVRVLTLPWSMRRVFFVAMTGASRWGTAEAQPWTQERLQRKKTNHQGKGQPEGSREEAAHARASLDPEKRLLLSATERTVKVHQSRTSKVTAGPWALIAANWRQCVT